MYLSKIFIPQKFILQYKLYNPYVLHQHIWSLFNLPNNSKRPFLYKLNNVHNGFLVLIFSKLKPTSNTHNVRTIEVPESFFTRSDYVFSITANPTIKTHSKISPITDMTLLSNWFHNKSKINGFDVENLTIRNNPTLIFNKNKHKVCLSSTTFSGKLIVQNPSLFKSACINGIGRGKSFGFGLLCLS